MPIGLRPPERVATPNDAVKLRALKIAGWCFLASLFLTRVAAPIADLDMWHEMALIRESVRAGHLLTEDVFAYTPTVRPVVDHEWGAGAMLYLAGCGAGGWAVVTLKFLLALLTAAAVLKCAFHRRSGFEEMAALMPLSILLFGLGCATLRAQAYSFLFFAILLYFLELDSAGRRVWIVIWPFLFVLWVNLHGGWVIGIIALGLYWMEQVIRRRPHVHVLGAAAISLGLLAANPYGVAYYRHMWAALTLPRPAISEWLPIWHAATWHVAVFAATLLVAAYAIVKRGWRSVRGAPTLAAMALGTVLHMRIVPFYAVAWAACVPSYVSGTPLGDGIRGLFRKREAATMVCLVLTMFFAVMAIEIPFWALAVPNGQYPVGAVRYLADQGFRGNLMTPFQQGAYVSWRLYPAVKVSIDSRYETAFPPAVVDENLRLYAAAPGWRETLAKYPTDLVLTFRHWFLTPVLPGAGWKLVYVDRVFEIYARPGLELAFRDDSGKDFQDVFP